MICVGVFLVLLTFTGEIASLIRSIRDRRVILDADLAPLYGVETRALVQAIKRNADRFPEDFLFQLSSVEAAALRSQIVISKPVRGGRQGTMNLVVLDMGAGG